MSTRERPVANSAEAPQIDRVVLVAIDDQGGLVVRSASGGQFVCDWLDTGQRPVLNVGDTLLALKPAALARGVVLGRVGSYSDPVVAMITATESLTLRCGQASVELRADGKVMLKGEDVLLRAKGTQRIRAGNVAIN